MRLGRKPRAGQTASARVEIRLTPDERREWERAAGERSLSEWLRSLAASQIGTHANEPGEPRHDA